MTTICNECGLECEAEIVDNGIGSYEYWGQMYTDHRWEEVSPCCGVSVVEGGNKTVSDKIRLARKNHKDGIIKKGDYYRIIITRCWRKDGPSWYSVWKKKLKLEDMSVFSPFKFLNK